MRIAVLGASGFVGSAVCAAARGAGQQVVEIRAPRLGSTARSTAAVLARASRADDDVAALAASLTGVQVVINAAGLATPAAPMTDALVGANALLPGVVVRAAAAAGAHRVVHVSSAAVHGHAAVLDASLPPQPASPYGWTKLWGERVAAASAQPTGPAVITYRPTSVHGPGRAVTNTLTALARSRLSSVAAPGDDPTPQVTVEQVAALAVELAVADQVPAGPVIHPWQGWTTASFLEHLGGRRPLLIPRPLARAVLAVARTGGRLHPGVAAQARRLQMLWFGQRQRP